MGKAIANTALGYLGGRIDNWVYRNTDDGIVVAKRPRVSDTPPTPARLEFQQQFRKAVAYAQEKLQDPQLGPRYRAAAEKAGMRPFNFAFADFMKAPQIERIETGDYHGGIGDPILVNITKEFELKSVVVKLLTPANAVVEEGAAVFVNGGWRYDATTVVAPGTQLVVRVIAKDTPGNTGDGEFPIVVG